jgi:hypothetical protein
VSRIGFGMLFPQLMSRLCAWTIRGLATSAAPTRSGFGLLCINANGGLGLFDRLPLSSLRVARFLRSFCSTKNLYRQARTAHRIYRARAFRARPQAGRTKSAMAVMGLVAVGFLACEFMLYVLFQWTRETIRRSRGSFIEDLRYPRVQQTRSNGRNPSSQ